MAFAYIIRSKFYVELGEKDKALADLSSAIKETPNDVDVYEKRTNLYYYMKKKEDEKSFEDNI